MKLYNSLSGKKENLLKTKGKPLRLFVCGPTTYDEAHIGHARTYLAFDVFVRYLRSRGFEVFYLQNITDIDNRIIDRARREKKNPLALARFFEKRYREDMKNLGIDSVSRYALATDFIPQIVQQVQTLIKKGYAYKVSDGYYFNVKKFKDYGKLSRRTALQAEDAVSRIDESIGKKNRGDFALWKFSMRKPEQSSMRKAHANKAPMRIINGEPAWHTSLGWGRPGWHIEDTAISEKFFGPQYELHGGGLDLKFPHHEAEIAQQEAASGKKPFVKIWMHVGMLNVEGKKMAKSLKNFITIRKFLKKHSPQVLRMIILKRHYRTPINYTEKLAAEAETEILSIVEFLEKLRFVESKYKSVIFGGRTSQILKRAEKEFHKAMEDDLNTPQALAAFFELPAEFQKGVWGLSRKEAKEVRIFTENLLKIFGLVFKPLMIPQKIRTAIERREILRGNKQFVRADALRKKIRSVGYEVEDTPLGPLVLPKSYAQDQNKTSAPGLRS